MELDEFKKQVRQKDPVIRSLKSEEDIGILLSKRMQSILSRIKRNIWIELWLCIVFAILFALVGIFGKYHFLSIYFSVFAVVFVLVGVALWFLLKKIAQLHAGPLPVKQNLQKIHDIMKEFVKRYFQLTMGLIPVCLVFSFLLGYYGNEHVVEIDPVVSKMKSPTALLVFLVIYIIAFTIGAYYFTKWYLKKVYGNYLAQLQLLIFELEEA